MSTHVFHPATIQLLRLQSRGRRRRIWQRFCQPRRLVLSSVACLLAVAWLGNAVSTIWLRETASPETLRALLSLGLVLYTLWHFTKAAFFRPESPFDWTPAEHEVLSAMPLRPRDLVAYQLASVTLTTIVKAGLFTLLLLPDLRCLPLGFLGVLLAMLTLELLRVATEVATWGMSRTAFVTYRAVTVAGLLAAGFAGGAVILEYVAGSAPGSVGASPFQPLVEIATQLNASALGYAGLPFRPLVELILADKLSFGNFAIGAAAAAALSLLGSGIIGLYSATCRRVAQRQRRDYCPSAGAPRTAGALARVSRPVRRIPRFGGVGPLAWRQLVGARRRWGSLAAAMIAPAVLAVAPCFVIADDHLAFLATVGTLAFYTFLLLPTVLRFDFHRDLDRLAALRGLPIAPAAAVLGQTLAPVLIATLFQSAVLAFALVLRSQPPYHLLVALLVMIPMNALVFGLDNLIYLLYPYRLQQEGLEIFFRTMLTFTGKGLLFTLGLVVVSAWGFVAAALTRWVAEGTSIAMGTYALFAVGLILGLSSLAALVFCGLCRTYRGMNPIEDLPR